MDRGLPDRRRRLRGARARDRGGPVSAVPGLGRGPRRSSPSRCAGSWTTGPSGVEEMNCVPRVRRATRAERPGATSRACCVSSRRRSSARSSAGGGTSTWPRTGPGGADRRRRCNGRRTASRRSPAAGCWRRRRARWSTSCAASRPAPRPRGARSAAAEAPAIPARGGPRTTRSSVLYLCCHPALRHVAIALTLSAVGGLTTAEIARAFLVPEATMGQRISRAKQRVRASGVPFRHAAPRGARRPARSRAPRCTSCSTRATPAVPATTCTAPTCPTRRSG